MRHIKLSDLSHLPLPAHRVERFIERYPVTREKAMELINQARIALERRNLRYDTKTGIVRDNHLGVVKSLVSVNDIATYDNHEEVLEWEFTGDILNSAQRILNGHNP